MAARKQRGGKSQLIWERSEPTPRPTLEPLSRDLIVRASLAIADKEGLASVSLRNVGSALNAGPMRLYGFITTKEELLDLMVDAVYGEMTFGDPIPKNWRKALRSIARQTRQASHQHPWFVELLGGRPHQGPNALAYLETTLGALSRAPGLEKIDAVLMAAKAINAYLIGAMRSEASESRAERESGMSKAEWQNASGPYISRMIATGRYPTLARVVRDATHPSADAVFEQGLETVLDGIEARFPS